MTRFAVTCLTFAVRIVVDNFTANKHYEVRETREDRQRERLIRERIDRNRAELGLSSLSVIPERNPHETNTEQLHTKVKVGMTSSEVEAFMGSPSRTDQLGTRELWNYASGSVPSKWQILIEDGKVIGTYRNGMYRFSQN